ncbi:PucR family transcriptional regulator [Mycolicibacterium confluentis]|uniref:PucR family transcriptional regulator n=1 Tax=Mycolicibacterium confluentis TaxID=28047 RepID=UPI000A1616F5|nr:PucR family transcriptional regulator [Mycolicibacterium confluentis]MCV7319706.1 PucR family transcriptional regulator [Mycolicibacterium confluentis]ORV34299.1 PucR family transcriptional regulator [Mycolicibacterium confluentis]
MAITARGLAAVERLGLTLAAGAQAADREISWAHAIELADPTPHLSGAELVMTTGINIGADDAAQFAYVQRLAKAGIAALAVDTGTTLSEVPPGVLAAGDALGLPVLKVPAKTPFIAITRVVIDALRADELRSVQRVVDQQEVLARATLRGGIPGVVDALADCLGATVVVVGTDGAVLAAVGADQDRLTAVLADTDLTRRHAASVLADGSAYVTVQALRAARPVRGHLAVRTEWPMSNADRLLVAHAVSLISIAVEKPASMVEAEQMFRAAVAREMLCGSGIVDDGVLRHFGFEPNSEVVVAVCADVGPVLSAQHRTSEALGSGPHLMVPIGDDVVLVLPAARSRRRIEGVLSALGADSAAGVSPPVRIGDAAVGLEQARLAAHSGGEGLVEFGQLGGFGALLGGRSTAELQMLAAPLQALGDDRELIATLTAFLRYNGQVEAAAADLDVHRHTLRNRLRRIMALLGDDLESADMRTQLWLAVKADRLLGERRR